MKKNSSTIILLSVFVLGLSLLLYPSFSNYWNSFHSSRAIGSYAEQVSGLDEDRYQHLWQSANDYNQSLRRRPNPYVLTDELAGDLRRRRGVALRGLVEELQVLAVLVACRFRNGAEHMLHFFIDVSQQCFFIIMGEVMDVLPGHL